MNQFTTVDFLAVGWFLASWLGHTWLIDASPWRRRTLSYAMEEHRRRWMGMMAARELRMIDTSILIGLQNGTAFFASTSLLALGGGFALLNATDRMLQVFSDLPLEISVSRALWEVKVLGLMTIYAYAFFKFGWAYRLFNYSSILLGAVPPADTLGTPDCDRALERAAEMNIRAGLHFNRGLRAFFMSIGFLGWFINGWVFMVATTLIVAVLIRRQFLSASERAARIG